MRVFSRHNAVVGYVTWVVTKRVIRRKAKHAVPSIDPETKRPNKSAIALLLAGTAGILALRRRSGVGDDDQLPPPE